MKTHVARTVSACFAVLRQLRSIRRSVPRPVLQQLVVVSGFRQCYISWRPDVTAETTTVCAERRRSAGVFFAQARPRQSAILRQLHWLKAPERIQYKLAVLVYKCLNGMAPSYLADKFLQPADLTTGHGFVRHRHCSFAVHGCLLSATERFRSLLPVFGTVCRVMSPPLHLCLSTVAA